MCDFLLMVDSNRHRIKPFAPCPREKPETV